MSGMESPAKAARRRVTTKLQRFLLAECISSAAIEKRSGIARPTFFQIRAGRDVRLSTMVRVLRAVRQETGRRVRMEDIFDIDPDD
jgi:predicted transcriptional regulator